jgi:hypothetical protein
MTSTTVLAPGSRATSAPSTLEGRDILCFSHDWNGDPLSKTHLMRLLARHGVDHRHFRRALDPATEVPQEMSCLRPLVRPAGRTRAPHPVTWTR